MFRVLVKRDVQDSDEEAVRVKEQSILELGGLLAKTGQAAGERRRPPPPNLCIVTRSVRCESVLSS